MPRETNKALKWVEDNFPGVTDGKEKARLIVAFGAGLDAGLAEAQEVLQETTLELLKKLGS